MDKIEKQMIDIVNRHHEAVSAVDRIVKNLDCDMLARRLNTIAARRKKGNKK